MTLNKKLFPNVMNHGCREQFFASAETSRQQLQLLFFQKKWHFGRDFY